MRLFASLCILLTASAAIAQTTEPATLPEKTDEKAWAFSLSAYTYIVPNDPGTGPVFASPPPQPTPSPCSTFPICP